MYNYWVSSTLNLIPVASHIFLCQWLSILLINFIMWDFASTVHVQVLKYLIRVWTKTTEQHFYISTEKHGQLKWLLLLSNDEKASWINWLAQADEKGTSKGSVCPNESKPRSNCYYIFLVANLSKYPFGFNLLPVIIFHIQSSPTDCYDCRQVVIVHFVAVLKYHIA